jgi:hypothetical protein
MGWGSNFGGNKKLKYSHADDEIRLTLTRTGIDETIAAVLTGKNPA